MRRILMALAAGAVLAAGIATAARAQTMLDSGIRDEPYSWGAEPAYPSNTWGQYSPDSPTCRTVTIHERHNGHTVARQVPRC
jgi:hypothetical protein